MRTVNVKATATAVFGKVLCPTLWAVLQFATQRSSRGEYLAYFN